jgi:hypothetical protein
MKTLILLSLLAITLLTASMINDEPRTLAAPAGKDRTDSLIRK